MLFLLDNTEVDNTTEAGAFERVQEMQPLVKALFRLTLHKHSKFVLAQVDMVKATWTLMAAQSSLANLGPEAADVCAADIHCKALKALEKARKDVRALRTTLTDMAAASAPTEELPGETGDSSVDISKLDLETAFFKLQIDRLPSKHFDSELATDTVAFYCAQLIQRLEEGQGPLVEHARLGMDETSWKRCLPEDPTHQQVLEAGACLLKSAGRAFREEVETCSKDSGGHC